MTEILTAEEKETIDALVQELDTLQWLMDKSTRESRRYPELYASILPEAQEDLGGMKTAPHGKEALLAELDSTRNEVAHFKALAGETDGNRTRAQHFNLAKVILRALYLMEVLSAYAYSLGSHMGAAFSAGFRMLTDKNNPQFMELEAREPHEVKANYLLALYSGVFDMQPSTHGGYPAVDQISLGGPIPDKLEEDNFLPEIPTAALGSPTINQQTTRLLSRSQIEDFVRRPETAITKTFATIRQGGGENLGDRVKDVFKVQGAVAWACGLTVYIVHRGSDDKCAYGYAVEEFRDFLNPALEENSSVYEVVGN